MVTGSCVVTTLDMIGLLVSMVSVMVPSVVATSKEGVVFDSPGIELC